MSIEHQVRRVITRSRRCRPLECPPVLKKELQESQVRKGRRLLTCKSCFWICCSTAQLCSFSKVLLANRLRYRNAAPKIIVKKEPPSSPTISSQTRPRPRKLDLSASTLSVRGPAGPMTARDGLALHEVGLACLSPGFQTHDPERQEQLQRSIAVREQQRSIIESRLQKSAKGDGRDSNKSSESNPFGSLKIAKKRPPPGLSIVPPSASQFANERIVQSAPLHKTFTGRHDPMPITRHLIGHTPNLPSPSHIHHVPAQQTSNRLPPLSDVFGSDLNSRERERERNGMFTASGVSSQSNTTASTIPPFSSSPGHNGTSQQRPREYRSAEEAVQELSGRTFASYRSL